MNTLPTNRFHVSRDFENRHADTQRAADQEDHRVRVDERAERAHPRPHEDLSGEVILLDLVVVDRAEQHARAAMTIALTSATVRRFAVRRVRCRYTDPCASGAPPSSAPVMYHARKTPSCHPVSVVSDSVIVPAAKVSAPMPPPHQVQAAALAPPAEQHHREHERDGRRRDRDVRDASPASERRREGERHRAAGFRPEESRVRGLGVERVRQVVHGQRDVLPHVADAPARECRRGWCAP